MTESRMTKFSKARDQHKEERRKKDEAPVTPLAKLISFTIIVLCLIAGILVNIAS